MTSNCSLLLYGSHEISTRLLIIYPTFLLIFIGRRSAAALRTSQLQNSAPSPLPNQALTAWQKLALVESQMANKKNSLAILAKGALFKRWCGTEGLQSSPVSYRSVAGFVVDHVLRNQGSTRSVAHCIGSIKACKSTTDPWLKKDCQGESAQEDCQGASVRRHVTWASEESPPPFPPASDVWKTGKTQGSGAAGGPASFHRS